MSGATINEKGAVLLGKNFACDGLQKGRSVGVVTHAHADHTAWLESGLYWYPTILATPSTRDLLIAREGDWLEFRRYLKSLEYETPFQIEEEKLTLYPSRHILGSAQVLVEDYERKKYLYTSDFFVPHTPVIETDVLIVDSTYGHPNCVRKYSREEASKAIIELVRKGLKMGPVWISAHFGKLQETMNLLAEERIEVSFLVDTLEDFRGARVYQKYGKNMGNLMLRVEGRELLKKAEPCVVFTKPGKIPPKAKEFPRILVSGWAEFDGAVSRFNENHYRVALSDHADFKETLEYIKRINPQLVITDNSRGPGEALAEAIVERLGIKAIAIP